MSMMIIDIVVEVETAALSGTMLRVSPIGDVHVVHAAASRSTVPRNKVA